MTKAHKILVAAFVALALAVAISPPFNQRPDSRRHRAQRIQCVNNMVNVTLSMPLNTNTLVLPVLPRSNATR